MVVVVMVCEMVNFWGFVFFRGCVMSRDLEVEMEVCVR